MARNGNLSKPRRKGATAIAAPAGFDRDWYPSPSDRDLDWNGKPALGLMEYWHFLVAAVQNQAQVGSVMPSQRFLVQKMIAPIPASYNGTIVELGAGTGSLTRRLVRRCPQARVLACEINAKLARHLAASLQAEGLGERVAVIAEPAQDLLADLASDPANLPQFVVSGIPLGTLDSAEVQQLVSCIHQALRPGGLYIQFQYTLMDRRRIRNRFSEVRTVPVMLNFPPAFVYYARKRGALPAPAFAAV
jgi:phospholipid N-methyltransferase